MKKIAVIFILLGLMLTRSAAQVTLLSGGVAPGGGTCIGTVDLSAGCALPMLKGVP